MGVVDTVIEEERWAAAGLGDLAERAARATLDHLGLAPGDWEIALLGCDDARIAALNADFRGKGTPTNVLSWPSEERRPAVPGDAPVPPAGPDPALGDIAISYDTCAREAAAAGRALEAHVLHLVVHAVLHLLGHDHDSAADAARMEAREVEILAILGVANPY